MQITDIHQETDWIRAELNRIEATARSMEVLGMTEGAGLLYRRVDGIRAHAAEIDRITTNLVSSQVDADCIEQRKMFANIGQAIGGKV